MSQNGRFDCESYRFKVRIIPFLDIAAFEHNLWSLEMSVLDLIFSILPIGLIYEKGQLYLCSFLSTRWKLAYLQRWPTIAYGHDASCW